MSQSNEPSLALEMWRITVELNDGSKIEIGSGDLAENLREEIFAVVEDRVDEHIDHLKTKYLEV